MENTLSVLLQDDKSKWYTVSEEKVVGPYSSKEVMIRIQSGDLNFGSFLWKSDFSGWKRIYEIENFLPLLPSAPSKVLLEEAKKIVGSKQQKNPPPPPTSGEVRIWYAFISDAQYGPFSNGEMMGMIEAGQINPDTYVWKKGFVNWEHAVHVPEWSAAVATGTKAIEFAKIAPMDKRNTPRTPFEAKILLTDGKEVGWAVCRDISIGGMQILIDHVPGEPGTELKLNVNSQGNIPKFACEGKIVRVLEDKRGFSFRFTKLPADAKAAIEEYIETSQMIESE